MQLIAFLAFLVARVGFESSLAWVSVSVTCPDRRDLISYAIVAEPRHRTIRQLLQARFAAQVLRGRFAQALVPGSAAVIFETVVVIPYNCCDGRATESS